MVDRLFNGLKKYARRVLFKNLEQINSNTPAVDSLSLLSSYVLKELGEILAGQKLNFIDVGGAVNLQPHYEKLIGNANFYVFEPDERSYQDLVKTVGRYSHPGDFHYINKALSGKDGMRTLYLSNVPTGTSILKLKEDTPFFSKDHPYFFPMREINVQTYTLQTILDELGVKRFDAIKLDVQGAEFEIIKGIDQDRLSALNIVELEIGLHEVYENQTRFCDVMSYMSEKGFGLFDLRVNRTALPNSIDHISYHQQYFNTHKQSPSVSARVWEFDAVFFREPNWIINNNIERERILRIIAMYCVYNFFAEAIQAANAALTADKLSPQEHNIVTNAIINWNKKEQNMTWQYEKIIKETNNNVWGQYMWVPYPSN